MVSGAMRDGIFPTPKKVDRVEVCLKGGELVKVVRHTIFLQVNRETAHRRDEGCSLVGNVNVRSLTFARRGKVRLVDPHVDAVEEI